MSVSLKYLLAYPAELQQQVQMMLEQKRLPQYLKSKYTKSHGITNDKALRDYVMALKSRYMKKSSPLGSVQYDPKIHVLNNALGLNRYATRVQGGKLKTKNSIRISTVFKLAPEEFLNMIVVHELAHLKEKNHDKAFYQLCTHMQPDYHQLEFDLRVYLTQLDIEGEI